MAIIKMLLAYVLSLGQIFAPIGAWIEAGGEDAFFTEWSVTDEFTEDCYATIEKQPGEDFVVLNLADVQLDDDDVYGERGEISKAVIDKLVADTQPDLITLSGDNATGTISYLELVEWVDSYGIPWAPVMGNHDGQGCISEFWCAELFYEAENCLFRFGPEDMGYGNYIINITENDRIIHTFFMLDTHNDGEFTLEDGTTVEGYDHLWDNQIEWYKWAVNGIKDMAGRTVRSTAIMHIPVYEYSDAWSAAWNEEKQEFNPLYNLTSFGSNNEGVCSSPVNNGFFDVCKELGSTKDILVGHDHINDSSILYKGIRLSYSLKTGLGSYYELEKIGGTTLTFGSLGIPEIEHHYIDTATL